MICIYMDLQTVTTTILASQAAVICCVFAADLGLNRSVKTIQPSYYNTSTANVLRCGNLCERQGKCAAVTFDARERKCYMHYTQVDETQTEKGSKGRFLIKNYPNQSKSVALKNKCDKATQISVPTIHHMYGGCYDIRESCPTDKGYKRWNTSDMYLCIRYSQTTVKDQTEAQNLCKADGGHLVLIANDSMRSHLVDITTNLMVPIKEWTYFDGRDIDKTELYIDWNGEPAWLSWSSTNTIRQQEDCLDSNLKNDFHHFDVTCTDTRYYLLCQIDV